MNINDYDYQHSINSSQQFIEEDGVYEIKITKTDNLVGIKLLSNENISNSNFSNDLIIIEFDKNYLKSLEYEFVADVYLYLPCNCCSEKLTIPLEELNYKFDKNLYNDYENEDYENNKNKHIDYIDLYFEKGRIYRWDKCKCEIIRAYKRYSCNIPTIITYYKTTK